MKKPNIRQKISERFKNREDSEHEQASIRMFLVAGVFLYFWIAGEALHAPGFRRDEIVYSLALYEFLSVIYVVWIAFQPTVNRLRRFMAMATDFGAITLAMYFGGEAGAPLYPLYLWVILGNGFRFGVFYLLVSTGLAVGGFGVVLATAPPWKGLPMLSLGLFAGLIAVPAYCATLIRKLTEAKVQAEAASRAKSRFLAMISHELRTPLNAIIGMSDLLFRSRLDDDQLDMSRTIQLSGQALLSLIDSVLDFSRIEAGKTTISNDTVDLHNGLAELVSVVRHQAAEKSLALYVSIGADVPPSIVADWPHIRQILTNLLANAVKFTDRGWVSLQVSREAAAGGDRLSFVVEDTGIGIPENKLEVIFDAFAQVEDSMNRCFGGSGLGLAISQQLAESMGGRLSVASRVGVGSRFRVDLPLVSQPSEIPLPLPLHVIAFGEDLPPSVEAGLVSRVSLPKNEAEAGALVGAATIRQPVALVLHQSLVGQAGGLIATAQAQGVPIVMFGASAAALPQALVTLTEDAPSSRLGVALRVALLFAGRGNHPEEPSAEQQSSRPLRILVAEDNRVNVKVVRKILERAGHQTTVVGTGDGLLDALEAGSYDIVVADVNMPGMPLTDVVKLFRMANSDLPPLPIVALSADATVETRRECEAAGVDVYLTKPVVATMLLATIERLTRVEQPGLPFAGANVSDLTKHPGFTGPAALPVDWQAIDALVALGDEELVRELATDFYDDACGLIDAMEDAVAEGDIRHFRAECHALRSCAANVGARSVARLCQAGAVDADDFASEGRSFCARAREEVALYHREIVRYLTREASSTKQLW